MYSEKDGTTVTNKEDKRILNLKNAKIYLIW